MKTIQEVAKLSGVTTRTLQYYDKIGLLIPAKHSESGYRLYSLDNLLDLQKILIYKELGFSLEEVKTFLFDTSFNEKSKLQNQKVLLLAKRQQLKKMIRWIDEILEDKKDVSFEAFKKTVIVQVPLEWNEEQENKITLNSFENIQSLWENPDTKENDLLKNIENAFEGKTIEELQEITRQSFELQKKVVEEKDASKQQILLDDWLTFDVSSYHINGKEAYASTLLKEYHQDSTKMKALDIYLGEGITEQLINILQKYMEKAEKI